MTYLGLDGRRREQQLPEKPAEDAACSHQATRPAIPQGRAGPGWGSGVRKLVSQELGVFCPRVCHVTGALVQPKDFPCK